MARVARAGGLAVLQPWTLLSMLGARSIDEATRALLNWDLDVAATTIGMPEGTLICPSTITALVTNTRTGGDGAASVSDTTNTMFIRPAGQPSAIKFAHSGGTLDTTWNLDWPIYSIWQDTQRISFAYYNDLAGSSNGDVDTSGWNITFYLGQETGGFTNYYTFQPFTIYPNKAVSGWNLVTLDLTAPYSTVGTISQANPFRRIRMQLRGKFGTTGTLYIGPVYANMRTKAKVMFGYEDVDDSQETYAIPYLAAHHIRGSMHVVKDFVLNSAGCLTIPQIQAVYDAGWSVHNHSDRHQMLSTLTVDEILTDLRSCQSWMTGQGWTRGQSTFVYPRGPYTSTFFDTMETSVFPAMGITHARVVRNVPQVAWDGIENKFRMAGLSTGSGVSLATLKTAVDTAIKTGGTVIFYTHDLDPSSPGANGVTTAIHHGLVDYVVGKRDVGALTIPTLQEYIDEMRTPRRSRVA